MRAAAIFGVLALAIVAVPADARRIATDTPDENGETPRNAFYDTPGCTRDGKIECKRIGLGFSGSFGGGDRTGDVYIYDDGYISFGTERNGELFPAYFEVSRMNYDLGHFDLPSCCYVDGPKFYRVAQISRATNQLTITWSTIDATGLYPGASEQARLEIFRDVANRRIKFTWDIEDFVAGNFAWNNQDNRRSDFPNGYDAAFGYEVGHPDLDLTGVLVPEPISEMTALTGSFSIAGGVPEPSSWALLIAGFGLTGGAMRRRRILAV